MIDTQPFESPFGPSMKECARKPARPKTFRSSWGISRNARTPWKNGFRSEVRRAVDPEIAYTHRPMPFFQVPKRHLHRCVNGLTYLSGTPTQISDLATAAYLHGYADGSARIWFALHHVIVDRVSWTIILRDLELAAMAVPRGARPINLEVRRLVFFVCVVAPSEPPNRGNPNRSCTIILAVSLLISSLDLSLQSFFFWVSQQANHQTKLFYVFFESSS